MNLNLTLIGQSLTFFLFAWFCMKFIWPFIKDAMRERQETIAQGLAAGEEAERKLAQAESGAEEERVKAKAEAAEIIDQARQRAGQMIEDARVEAREEGERLVEAARSEIDQEVNRAREALRAQVAALAVSGAEK
ncbi:MAG: F0F1 ATP synthase subunit B, partial [Gammaproteobacteria bacterium]|nr:F0F1 ATP synthase subunit B [Gammaproteobacteria bacterium]